MKNDRFTWVEFDGNGARSDDVDSDGERRRDKEPPGLGDDTDAHLLGEVQVEGWA